LTYLRRFCRLKWQTLKNCSSPFVTLINDQNLLTLKNNRNQPALLLYCVMECKYSETARGFFPNHLRIIGLKKLLPVWRKAFLYNVTFVSILLIQRISQVSFYTRNKGFRTIIAVYGSKYCNWRTICLWGVILWKLCWWKQCLQILPFVYIKHLMGNYPYKILYERQLIMTKL